MPRESDMLPAVNAWLAARGCYVTHESMTVGYTMHCDVVGVRFGARIGRAIPPLSLVVIVELKLTDVAGVIRQAKENLSVAHESYAAMPRARCRKMLAATEQKFRRAGVGLLSVDGQEVTVRIESGKGYQGDRFRKKLWRRTRFARGPNA